MRFFHALPLALAVAVSWSAASAQSAQDHAKHQAAQKQDMGKMDHMAGPWKEMNAFHTLLAATFHPVQSTKDLKALREKADSLAATSRIWAASTAPAACGVDSIRSSVLTIAKDALAIENQVRGHATDADLTKAITVLHEKFESVEKKCAPHDMKGMKH